MRSRGFLGVAIAGLGFVALSASDCVSALADSDIAGRWVADNPVILGSSPAPPSTAASEALQRSPFVFSLPRRLPPFPIVLNQTVQRYVREILSHPAGLRLCYERSNP